MSSIKLTADSGGGTVELKAPATTNSNAAITFKLPLVDGTNGQALTTNASGQLAFSSVSAGGASNIAFNSGYGIDFSATADGGSATPGSELFDDYEEGTWTPVLARSSGTTQSTYVNQIGTYTKIGRVVHAICNLYTTSGLGGTGYYHLNGLPFTPDTSATGSTGDAIVMHMSRMYLGNADFAAGGNAYSFRIVNNQTYLRLRNLDSNGLPGTGAFTGNTFIVNGIISYFTAT